MEGTTKHDKLSVAQQIMVEFAGLTGILPGKEAPRRYLWTDAFAVCNFLELYRQTGEERYKTLALALVDQVHGTLGRHRRDDPRTGWISGLDEQEGASHPTLGGLRIGKKMNERGPDDPLDERLEWDRDGQYYHYLTRWMHALGRIGAATRDPVYSRWAVELAKTAHAGFTHGQRMYWKMSIDLSYPLVLSMGQHDPLDGLITYYELQAGAPKGSKGSPNLDLSREIADMARMCRGRDWSTNDPLGIGSLLCDAYRAVQLGEAGAFEQADLLSSILDASLYGLSSYAGASSLKAPARYRLAFRELGLSIGLHAVERMERLAEAKPAVFPQGLLKRLARYVPLAQTIESFWFDPANRKDSSFVEHRDINTVMLATSLIPDGYLQLRSRKE